MSIRIRIEHGQDAGKTVRLPRPGVYVLGRHTDSSMRIIDMKVSKAHAEVHLVENNGSTKAILRDLKSTHGSQVNGQPISADTGLNPGDEIRLGLTILRVLSDGAADEELSPRGQPTGRPGETSRRAPSRPGSVDVPKSGKRQLPPDELVGKELGGYKPRAEASARAVWARSTSPSRCRCTARSRSRCCQRQVRRRTRTFVDQFVNEARSGGRAPAPQRRAGLRRRLARRRQLLLLDGVRQRTARSRRSSSKSAAPTRGRKPSTGSSTRANALVYARQARDPPPRRQARQPDDRRTTAPPSCATWVWPSAPRTRT